MKKSFLLVSFLIFSCPFIFAQAIPWERISPKPIESSLEEIVNVPGTERLIAIGSNATIMHSNNMGASWIINYKAADISRMTDLNAIQFVNSSLGFAAGDNSTLLKTVDGGLSWAIITVNGEIDFLDVYFLDEQIGFVTKKDTIMKTTDGGVNWTQTKLSSSYWYSPKHLHFINDSTGFIGNTQSSFYYETHNAGETWDSVGIIPAIENFSQTDIEFIDENIGFISGTVYNASNHDHLILRTTDGGITWNQVYSHYFNSVENIYFFDSQKGFAVGPRVMYDNMILWTEDGGLNWQESNMSWSSWSLNSISFLANGKGLCVGSRGQILISEDWGKNWELNNESEIRAAKINDVQVADETTMFIGTTGFGGGVPSGNIYKSTDSGNTWESVYYLWPISRLQFLNNEFGVAIGPGYGEVYKTTDGGELWETKIINELYFTTTSIYFINEQIGFVGGEENWSAIYKTSDGGESWVKNNSYDNSFDEISDITFIDDSNGFAVDAYCDEFFLKTLDQGETWIIDTFDIPIFANKIYFTSPEIGFVIGYYKILKTFDGGDTWSEVPHGLEGFVNFTDIDFPTEEAGYITVDFHEESILKSTDGGDTWDAVGFECTSTPTTVAFFSEDEGLAMGDNGIIFKTFTGGLVGTPENSLTKTENRELICFPNPVANTLNIDLSSSKGTKWHSLEFYTSNGHLVKRIIVSKEQPIIQVDVSSWEDGVYFIVSKSSDAGYRFAKIIKIGNGK